MFTQHFSIWNAIVRRLGKLNSCSAPIVLASRAFQPLYRSLLPNSCVFSGNDRDIPESFRIPTLGACFIDLHILSFAPVNHANRGGVIMLDTSNLNRVVTKLIPTLWTGESAGRFDHV
jgi:hypothetical protein